MMPALYDQQVPVDDMFAHGDCISPELGLGQERCGCRLVG